ncbi:hypothetical protein LX36DRAFT_94565 [Colletotrichum falcatum]|nr:hypothetical protein LX36DRAFT_94565 [Colletotrichum falcatum]
MFGSNRWEGLPVLCLKQPDVCLELRWLRLETDEMPATDVISPARDGSCCVLVSLDKASAGSGAYFGRTVKESRLMTRAGYGRFQPKQVSVRAAVDIDDNTWVLLRGNRGHKFLGLGPRRLPFSSWRCTSRMIRRRDSGKPNRPEAGEVLGRWNRCDCLLCSWEE